MKWIIYNGISHLKRALKTLDFQNFGEVFAHFFNPNFSLEKFVRRIQLFISMNEFLLMKNKGLPFGRILLMQNPGLT